jgi:hypothetical protein
MLPCAGCELLPLRFACRVRSIPPGGWCLSYVSRFLSLSRRCVGRIDVTIGTAPPVKHAA